MPLFNDPAATALGGYRGAPDVEKTSFAGPKANLNEQERRAYELALRMERTGRSREEIWRETGKLGAPWFKDPRGHWWMEFSDEKMQLEGEMEAMDENDPTKRKRMRDIMKHPELDRLYDKLGDVSVGLFRGDPEASYDEKSNPKTIDIAPGGKNRSYDLSKSQDIADVLSHEWSHGIEDDEIGTQTDYGQSAEVLPELTKVRRKLNMKQRLARPPWTQYKEAIRSYPGGGLDPKDPQTQLWLKD